MNNLHRQMKNYLNMRKFEKMKKTNVCYEQFNDLLGLAIDMEFEFKELEKAGHTHFMKTEIENKMLELIERDESIILIPGFCDKNIVIQAAQLGFSKVAFRALDNHEASIQQDIYGNNLGMICASHGLEDCVLKALDNPIASIQQNQMRENIGMIAASRYMNKAVLKALDNHEASIQTDSFFDNIGMLAAFHGLEDCVLKSLQNPDSVKEQNQDGKNIAMLASESKMKTAVLECLKNPWLLESKDKDGESLLDYIKVYFSDDALFLQKVDNQLFQSETIVNNDNNNKDTDNIME